MDEVEVSLENQQEKLIESEAERSDLETEVDARRSEVESLRRRTRAHKTRLGSQLSENTAKLDSLEERVE